MRRSGSGAPAAHLGRFTVEQRRLMYRGREFHFVSYDGVAANPKREQLETLPAWWLMGAGTRWEAIPYRPGQAPEELDRKLTQWIDKNVLGPPPQGA